MALLSQLTYYATSFARPGFDFRMLLPPLFEDAVRARASGDFSGAEDEYARTPEKGWAAVRAAHSSGTTASAFYMPPQALLVYPPIAILANVLRAPLNGLRLCWVTSRKRWMPLSEVLVHYSKFLEMKHGAATAFLRLLVLFVRKGMD
ncbi:hypothetical protein DFH94DRAFT_708345 [Russula ochroleuca]|jgi:hypothetical protein|uniref:Conserved oligomeric Golgi complex subunit 8 n=1 Tax=Russula ochroleuca TaxID=152965 RepID=A0A9P5N3V5_9AGAM|nr:hypothetical protein DFH94DRAFT_708345 [Russula ochroleuca]